MNIYINNNIIKHVYAGGIPVRKIYKGNSPTPIWQINQVVFKDWDDTILKTEDVVTGNSATPPENPTRDGYNFTGWSVAFDNIDQDIIIQAQYESAYITNVDSVLNTASLNNNTIDYQNKSFGYMEWSQTGTSGDRWDLPTWSASIDQVFDDESRLGQSLYPVSVIATGYNGSRVSANAGRSGIALKSMTPKIDILYTKVKLSPYYVVYTSVGMEHIQPTIWNWDDISPAVAAMPPNPSNTSIVYKGKAFYTRGRYFMVTMTIQDNTGTHTLSCTQDAGVNYSNGWHTGSHPLPTTLTFDFTQDIINKKLSFGAKTTKIQFFENMANSSFSMPAIINAICLYNDTINPIS